jgi:hypothetical protein
VHPAQKIKPAIRMPDRMRVRNVDIVVIYLRGKKIKIQESSRGMK